MSELLSSLRQEHIELLTLTNLVRSAGLGTPEGAAALKQFFEKLNAHIKKENESFYPQLIAASERTDILFGLNGIVQNLAHEMEAVAKEAEQFQRDYEAHPAHPAFEGRFHRLADQLVSRIRKEDDTIFRFYEKLVE